MDDLMYAISFDDNEAKALANRLLFECGRSPGKLHLFPLIPDIGCSSRMKIPVLRLDINRMLADSAKNGLYSSTNSDGTVREGFKSDDS